MLALLWIFHSPPTIESLYSSEGAGLMRSKKLRCYASEHYPKSTKRLWTDVRRANDRWSTFSHARSVRRERRLPDVTAKPEGPPMETSWVSILTLPSHFWERNYRHSWAEEVINLYKWLQPLLIKRFYFTRTLLVGLLDFTDCTVQAYAYWVALYCSKYRHVSLGFTTKYLYFPWSMAFTPANSNSLGIT